MTELSLQSFNLDSELGEYRVKDLPDGCVAYVYEKNIFKNCKLNYWALKFWKPEADINGFTYEVFDNFADLKSALSEKINNLS